MDSWALEQTEKYVLRYFQARQNRHSLAQDHSDSTNEFATADLVRALEDLEK